jgi:acyl dehydratase
VWRDVTGRRRADGEPGEASTGTPVDKIGTWYDERVATIDGQQARAYAAATNDDHPDYDAGAAVPPLFVTVPTWDAVALAITDLLSHDELLMSVHGDHDIHFHHPLVAGMTIRTRAGLHAVRVGSSGTRLTIRAVSNDDRGVRVVDQFATVFVRGMTDGATGGPDAPAHDFPLEARVQPLGTHHVHVDDDQTFRYRDVSGDRVPIHVDEQAARRLGLPGIIAHGLCTAAMCSHSVLRLVGDAEPARVRRLAVRFAAHVFPGNDIATTVYDAGERQGRRCYAFEAESAGATVVKNGWVESAPSAQEVGIAS